MTSTPLKIYMNYRSQPSRALMAFCRINKIPFTTQEIDVFKAQQFTPEFKNKVNGLRAVPVIDEDGFLLSESHSIFRYLCDSRNLPDHWFPKDLKQRALVNRYLDWHPANTRTGLRYYQAYFKAIYHPGWVTWETKDEVETVKRAYKRIEEVFLGDKKFLFSDEDMTIADLSAVCEIMQVKVTDFDFKAFPKLDAWIERCMEKYPEIRGSHKEFFEFHSKVQIPKL